MPCCCVWLTAGAGVRKVEDFVGIYGAGVMGFGVAAGEAVEVRWQGKHCFVEVESLVDEIGE